jgi:histidinol-phosphate aminotransferase
MDDAGEPVSDWTRLIRPQLLDVGPYIPGPSLAEQKAVLGLDEVAKLNWNEGLFGPLPGALDAAAAELDRTWEYPEHAYLELREAIGAEIGVPAAWVLPGHGIQTLILTLAAAFLTPGERVVVPDPTYGLYAQASRAAGAVVQRVSSPELRLDLEPIADAARRTRARMVWICDPNNPTGSLLEAAEWGDFLRALPEDCVVAADEAYIDFVPPEERLRREDDIAAGRPLIVLRTFSKIFGLAGLRLGYAVATPGLIPYLQTVQEPFNLNRPALVAGLASLGRPDEVAERRAATVLARERLASGLRDAGLEPLPSAANFLLVRHGADDAQLGDGLLRRGILVRSGAGLGLPGWARITVGPEPLMDRVATALPEVLGDLRRSGAPTR